MPGKKRLHSYIWQMKLRLLALGVFIYGFVCGQPGLHKLASIRNDTSYIYRSASVDGTGKFYLGREIARVMDASGADWLERPERQKEENTDKAIAHMNLAPASVVADIGAGTGYYTFRISSHIPQGKVYAVELQEELINYLNKKKIRTSSLNVEVIRGDTLKVNLPDSSIDVAILVDVYHELAWPREIIQSIRKSLKPDGRILLIEYRGEDPSVRIKALHKTTVMQLSREMNSNGFILEQQGNFLPIQHFLVFRKRS